MHSNVNILCLSLGCCCVFLTVKDKQLDNKRTWADRSCVVLALAVGFAGGKRSRCRRYFWLQRCAGALLCRLSPDCRAVPYRTSSLAIVLVIFVAIILAVIFPIILAFITLQVDSILQEDVYSAGDGGGSGGPGSGAARSGAVPALQDLQGRWSGGIQVGSRCRLSLSPPACCCTGYGCTDVGVNTLGDDSFAAGDSKLPVLRQGALVSRGFAAHHQHELLGRRCWQVGED